MPQKPARSAGTRVTLAALLSGVLLWASPSAAGILDATWTAPTMDTNGSPLVDLASYLVYYGTATSPCPGSSSVRVAAPTGSPGLDQTTSSRLTGLTTGTLYYVAITAVDSLGNQSACSSVASAVARTDFAVSPTDTVNFGSVSIGGFADQVFTISNTGGGTVSGTASTSAPFSIVSGSPFTLGGVGASQTVTVRFTPTSTAAARSTVNFGANGGNSSVIATGNGTASVDTTPPTITITTPTSSSMYTTGSRSVTIGGTAADNVGVTQVSWTNSQGGSGIASGTTTWTTGAIGLLAGSNVLTLTARDAAGNTGSAALTVTLSDTTPDTTPPTIAVTVPLAGATVSGTVTVSASATDNVGVAGVQFKLDAANLGAEVTAPPYAVTWDTMTAAGGAHTLSAVARDAAGNLGTSAGVPVTVASASPSAVPSPVISQLTLSVHSSSATIGWTTNTPADTQVQYGRTTSYGSLTPLDGSLVTSHSQVLNGLAQHTWYHLRMMSRDAAGNLTVSSDVKFRTR